jgi:hypothetical protein
LWLNTINRHRRWAAALLLARAGVAASRPPAVAHSFYSKCCGNDKDCAPVDAIAFPPGGAIKTTTRHGAVVFPAGHTMLPSKDGAHACMGNYYEWGDDRLRGVCLRASRLVT